MTSRAMPIELARLETAIGTAVHRQRAQNKGVTSCIMIFLLGGENIIIQDVTPSVR